MEDSPKKRTFNKTRKADSSSSSSPKKSRSFDKKREGTFKKRESGFKKSDDSYRKRDSDKPQRRFGSREENDFERKPRFKREEGDEKRSYRDRKPKEGDRYSEERKYPRRERDERGGERGGKTFKDRRPKEGDRYAEERKYPRRERDERGGERGGKTFKDRKPKDGDRYADRPKREYSSDKPVKRKRNITAESEILSEIVAKRRSEGRKSPQKQKILSLEHEEQYGPIRLNKYISNSGICSRRDADTLILTGAITVNGKIVTELGTKVMPTDEVRYGDQLLQREKPVYILLNKPKDYITTMYDDRDRKDVMELVRGACRERIYPVGRLDKNTTGLLLFTNDGEMAKKLTHPKHNIRKIYHVELNKSLSASDFDAISRGMELDDGFIKPDEISYVNESKREIGIEIHSGRNRIVRRIFESLEYDILKLDRVVFAGLDKKNLPRGKWRFLTQAEINILKMI